MIMVLLLLLFVFFWDVGGVPSRPATFSCSDDLSSTCNTYVAYRARQPDYLDVGSISDLLGVSRMAIVQASNLVSENDRLSPGRIVLVPIWCGCGGNNYSVANVSYEMKKDDNYYQISMDAFENLTDWHLVQEANPYLTPSLLPIGAKVIVPLYCKCPSRTLQDEGLAYLVTYVWENGDTVRSVARTFNASPDIIMRQNTDLFNLGDLTGHPVVIPLSQLPVIAQTNVRSRFGTSIFSHRWILVMVTAVAGTAFVLVLVASLLYVRLRRKEAEESLSQNVSMMEDANMIQKRAFLKDGMSEVKNTKEKLLTEVSDYLGQPIMYHSRNIMDGTRNLSERLRIGRSIYRGTIEEKVFAVKVRQGRESQELKISQRLNHSNLIKLVGVSSDREGSFFLVYEYAEKGSLDKWLYETPSSDLSSITFLNWNQKLRIALDIANGLQYLHEHAQPSIVHGNIKARNILLDSAFKAKISNFSAARPATSMLILKVDVLAFGIVLMELLSGRRVRHPKGNDDDTDASLTGAPEILQDAENREDGLKKLMDPKLFGSYPMTGALSMLAIAKACTEAEPSTRPSMSEVVFSLSVLAQSFSRSMEPSSTINAEIQEVVDVLPVTPR